MAKKKDTLKSSLIRKRPIIEENEAQEAVEKIHQPTPEKKQEEPEEETVKTSVDFRKSLYKSMKIKLIEEGMTMRQYLEKLVDADIKK